ncbi:MAG: GNAT family N-acetyltransferase [Acidimicrobiia bacterium]|nr:GNAT family N-acetyltransferase [Acidimicrobiia bacterium]
MTDSHPPTGAPSVDPGTVLRAVLDPLRLRVLAASIDEPPSLTAVAAEASRSPRDVAEAVGWLRSAGLLDETGRLDPSVLRAVGRSLPSVDSAPIEGPWTTEEAEILGRFFDGDRLVRIPSGAAKRRLIIERVALRFEPGVRYHEREVDFAIQLIHADYAAVRRYLVDEGFMDRADGSYWRIGGRDGGTTPATREPTILRTERDGVVLRTFDLSMAAELVIAANDPAIATYMSDRFPYPYSDEDAFDWIRYTEAEEPPLNFAIMVDDRLVGGCGATAGEGEATGSFEIGWWLNPAVHGRGVASTATRTLLDHVFGTVGAMEVFAPVMGPNVASSRVAAAVGLEFVGRRPDAYLKAGVRHDMLIHAITRRAWESR